LPLLFSKKNYYFGGLKKMPSITFINFDDEKLEIDLSKTDNLTAFQKGCQHLDKPLNKKLFNEFIKRAEK
tara:strand:- start:392 stop:601 length:210 start_codon:yes stop_codon:yes gene_type:complete